MRVIPIDLSSDCKHPMKIFGGYNKEHNETKLVVSLPQRLLSDVSYYYFDFYTVDNKHITSPNVLFSDVEDGNKISMFLWGQLTPCPGILKFCVVATKLSEFNDITVVGKTAPVELQIKGIDSCGTKDDCIDASANKELLQETIDNALEEAKNSGEFNSDKANSIIVYDKADSGTLSGQYVQFREVPQSEYDALTNKDSNTFYFCYDTGRIYKGTVSYTSSSGVADIDVIQGGNANG